MSLASLKQQIAAIEGQRPSVAGLPTGLDALDGALPGRGVPRGRLTEFVGPRGSGKTTVLRQLVRTTIAAGLRVGYVDATRTLAPRDWVPLAEENEEGLWVVRPKHPARGAWCADILLRSAAFGLVVLDGAPQLSRAVALRLTRLASDTGAALVVVGDDEGSATLVGGALRLRVKPAPRPARRTTVGIAIERGGSGHGQRRTIEVSYVVSMARRLCTHSEVPDRRGVARSRSATAPARAVAADAARSAPPPPPPGARVLSRKRRCAEPDFGGEPHVPASTLLARRGRRGVG
ncbi:MAG: AAA family ATPase [Gemmatimonadota bacterium]|nr:AAA family ATPase [Gemmatimonadota bacterium]